MLIISTYVGATVRVGVVVVVFINVQRGAGEACAPETSHGV